MSTRQHPSQANIQSSSNARLRRGHPTVLSRQKALSNQKRFVSDHTHSLSSQRPFIQPKLTIGQPNDKYEQEADRVADQVMSAPQEAPLRWMPEPAIQRAPTWPLSQDPSCGDVEAIQTKPLADQITPLVQRQIEPEEEEEELIQPKPIAEQITPLVQRQVEPEEEEEEESIQAKLADDAVLQRQEEELEEEEEEPIQTKDNAGTTPTVTPSLTSRINSLKGGGQPLPRFTCDFLEPRFGHDFSQVRVHADGQAANAARALNARAFTIGRDVMFGIGQYAPETGAGKRLLAHELTHVIQQEGSAVGRTKGSGIAVQQTNTNMIQRLRVCGLGVPLHHIVGIALNGLPIGIQRTPYVVKGGGVFSVVNRDSKKHTVRLRPPTLFNRTGALVIPGSTEDFGVLPVVDSTVGEIYVPTADPMRNMHKIVVCP